MCVCMRLCVSSCVCVCCVSVCLYVCVCRRRRAQAGRRLRTRQSRRRRQRVGVSGWAALGLAPPRLVEKVEERRGDTVGHSCLTLAVHHPEASDPLPLASPCSSCFSLFALLLFLLPALALPLASCSSPRPCPCVPKQRGASAACTQIKHSDSARLLRMTEGGEPEPPEPPPRPASAGSGPGGGGKPPAGGSKRFS